MTDREKWGEADEARLAQLMRRVPRGAADPAARARVFEAVHAEWRRSLPPSQGRPASKPARWLAAASVAVAALAGLLWWQSPPAQVATLERAQGVVAEAGQSLAAGAPLRRGASLVTAAGSGALLRYSPDLSLRIDAGSRVTLTDAGNLRLDAGRILVAATPGAEIPFVVHTDAGDVRHVGTRYVVSVSDGELDVAVRDGAIQLDAGSHAARARAGEALHVGAAGAIVRRELGGDAPWGWADKLVSPISIEGKTFAAFLRWYAAETGRDVRFADAATRARAQGAILHGSVDGLPPSQALAIVAASVDLEAVVPAQGPVVIGPAHR